MMVQIHAQEPTNFFKEHFPLAICKEIQRVTGNLWEEVKFIPTEDLYRKVEYWVVDPKNMVG